MDILSDSDDENQKKNKIQIVFFKKAEFSEFQLEDFQIMKILGRGAYGKVYLVFYKNNKEYYAMKSLKIENIEDDKQIYRCIENKKIQNLDFPFLIDVDLCFITDNRVYFIMEFVHGEDLLTSIRLNEEKFDEDQVKFFAVVLGLSLEYLHQNGIILKDLHLDNIIIDRSGYLKLINFKLGQLFNMKEESIIMKETSELLSPEVISSNACRNENDWWSYGIILYQLLFGIPPFYSNDDNEIRQQILNNELRFPKDSNISETAKDLLRLLLRKIQTKE
jgi:serine/threonine protein kinase